MRAFSEKIKRFNKLLFAVFYLITVAVPGIYVNESANANSVINGGASTTAASSSTVASINVTKPAGVVADDYLVAAVAVDNNTATITPPTVSSPYDWQTVTSSNNTNTSLKLQTFIKRASGSDGASFTFSVSPNARMVVGVSFYRGVDTSSPLDTDIQTRSSGSSSTDLIANSVTPSAPSKAIAAYSMNSTNAVTFTGPSGYIERVDNGTTDGSASDVSIEIVDKDQPQSVATGNMHSTSSAAGHWTTHQFALKATSTTHMMLFWDGANAPAGWSFVTEADSKFIRGEAPSNYATTGGGATHAPTSTVTNSAPTGDESATGGENDVATQAHTHTSLSVAAGTASNSPQHRTMKLIRYDAGIPNTIPAGAIAIFDGSPGIPATGWTRETARDNMFTKANSTDTSCQTTTCGNTNNVHTHSLTWSSLGTSSGQVPRGPLLFGVATASINHTHTAPAATNTNTNGTSAADCDVSPVADSCLPPYIQVQLAKADVDTAVLSIGLTAMFDGSPGGGWVVRSESGGPYYQRFMTGASSYNDNSGAGFGTTTHDHANATSGASGVDNTASGGTGETLGTGVAADNHTHTLTADFAAVNHIPEYYNIVVAEKVNFIFNHYAWYDDNNLLAVTSPYSGLNIGQDTAIVPIPVGNEPPDFNTELRLRIQILVNNSNLANDEMQFKLQYKEDTSTSLSSTTCTDGSWTDVGNTGDSTIWKYVASSGHPSDGATLTGTTVFSPASTGLHRYVRSTSAGKNIGVVSAGETMEWDYHIVNNGANPATQYRFRLVEDSGILLSQYGYGSPTVTPVCPTLTTKPHPENQLRHGNFYDNTGQEKGFSWVD